MFAPRCLSKLIVFPSESALTLPERFVNPPPLNLGVIGFPCFDQVVGRAATHAFEMVDLALDGVRAAIRQPLDPAGAA